MRKKLKQPRVESQDCCRGQVLCLPSDQRIKRAQKIEGLVFCALLPPAFYIFSLSVERDKEEQWGT